MADTTNQASGSDVQELHYDVDNHGFVHEEHDDHEHLVISYKLYLSTDKDC
jgi:hypothetical protein